MNRWEYFQAELTRARAARSERRFDDAWQALENAHVLGQPKILPHLASHWEMLALAYKQRDIREAMGQVMRLLGVIPATLLGRLPSGNIGRSTVSAFEPMPIRDELKPYIDGSYTRN